jgi:predicted kinase
MENNFFNDVKNPTMNELVNWFQVRFTDLANDMKTANHSAIDNEPNPYHTEDSVWTHTMMVCLRAEIDNANKIHLITALLHDIGKPKAREVIPFGSKKPVHTEPNELIENGKEDGRHSGLNEFTDREFKTHFRGHEGLSFYLAVKPLNELVELGVLIPQEVQQILMIISHHGTLFDNIKDGKMFKEQKVYEKWKNAPYIFEDFVRQVKYDSTGRFFMSKDGRKNSAFHLGVDLFGPEFVKPMKEQLHRTHQTKIISSKKITVLVGVPNVGKSTWIENYGSGVVISRDNTLMTYAKYNEIEGDYSTVWKSLTDEDQKEIDKLVREQFNLAVKEGKDIIIDMTNTSKKSRRKWLSQVPSDYRKEAVVFVTGYEEVHKRNKLRSEKDGKFIPEDVIENMMKGFMVPMYDEVDFLHWAFS